MSKTRKHQSANNSLNYSSGGRDKKARLFLRVLCAVLIVFVWFGAMGGGGPIFGKISEVSTNDQLTFLPAAAESTRAAQLQKDFGVDGLIPATIVAASTDDTAVADVLQQQTENSPLAEAAAALAELDFVSQLVGPQPSADGKALQFIALLDDDSVRSGAISKLREQVAEVFPASEWQTGVSGPAAFTADLSTAFAGIDGILLLVALIAVFIILVSVYRSIFLPVIVLLTSVAALCASIAVIYWLAKAELITLNGQVQGILSILVIGAATDYSLLLVARYREELLRDTRLAAALINAVKGTIPAILASGSTVALALLCLLFTELNSTRALGPVAATGIIFAMLAALTFLPALLFITRRQVFWPRIPKYTPQASANQQAVVVDTQSVKHENHRLYRAVARFVAAKPRIIWISVSVILIAGSLGVLGLKANGVPQSELVLGQTDTKQAQDLLAAHFSAGSGAPATIYVPAATADAALELVTDAKGVASAYLTAESLGPTQNIQEAKTVNNFVQLQATLEDASDSPAAEDTVRSLRSSLHELDSEILVGGTTATQLDTTDSAQHDLRLAIPLVLLVITLILVMLLRSIVAPLVLVATTVLSFGTALGVSSLLFNHVFDFPGADATVPLYGFMFLVALGVDYNIFLMERARTESMRFGTRDGILHALVVTGGVITSAGIVLAATFAALAVIPLMFMAQLAFLVAFGVLLDTFIVRTLLVPALGIELGDRLWWPRKMNSFKAQN